MLWGWRRALAPPIGLGLSTGLTFWIFAGLSSSLYEQGSRLPELTLRTANGESVQLSSYQGGPLVINLRATWCPPCRREMPVLQNAQKQHQDVTVFIRQSGRKHAERQYVRNPGSEPGATSCSTAAGNWPRKSAPWRCRLRSSTALTGVAAQPPGRTVRCQPGAGHARLYQRTFKVGPTGRPCKEYANMLNRKLLTLSLTSVWRCPVAVSAC